MPIYRFQMPDGRVARVQADDPDTASQYAGTLTATAPKPGASQNKPGRSAAEQQDYETELAKARALNTKGAFGQGPGPTSGALGKLNSFAAGEVGPIAGEIIGGLSAGGNALVNLFRPEGQKVSSRAIYEANRDATDEETARETDANPISAGTGSVARPAERHRRAGQGRRAAEGPAVRGEGWREGRGGR